MLSRWVQARKAHMPGATRPSESLPRTLTASLTVTWCGSSCNSGCLGATRTAELRRQKGTTAMRSTWLCSERDLRPWFWGPVPGPLCDGIPSPDGGGQLPSRHQDMFSPPSSVVWTLALKHTHFLGFLEPIVQYWDTTFFSWGSSFFAWKNVWCSTQDFHKFLQDR